jgi:hypothetical protein
MNALLLNITMPTDTNSDPQYAHTAEDLIITNEAALLHRPLLTLPAQHVAVEISARCSTY